MKTTFLEKIILALLLQAIFFCNHTAAQLPMSEPDGYDATFFSKDTKAENRQRLYKSLVNGINSNLSLPLTDSTEENWMDAFYSMELLRYKSPWVEGKVYEAFKGIENRSGLFQRSLMELVYDAYPRIFDKQAQSLLHTTGDMECFAISAEYLSNKPQKCGTILALEIAGRQYLHPDDPILKILRYRVLTAPQTVPPLKDLLRHTFFTHAKVVFSFQRKNRNYPGVTIVRDSAGNFVKDGYGNIFSVAQLARSISNIPGYISNGNTPQGIFRMYGFDVSKSIFIGPTPNVQLTMPGETSIRHLFNDSSIIDSVWTEDWYRKLLPESWKSYWPFFETYYAGKAGRTEIIAHGTTVDPNYYRGTAYYPFTPTLGCLCTKEVWNEETGRRTISGQQKLIEAIKKAGGADGYFIVIELNDENRAVDINDVLPYLK